MYEIPWAVDVDDIDGMLHWALDEKPNAAIFVDPDSKAGFVAAQWASDEGGLRRALESVSRGERPVNRREPRSRRLPEPWDIFTGGWELLDRGHEGTCYRRARRSPTGPTSSCG